MKFKLLTLSVLVSSLPLLAMPDSEDAPPPAAEAGQADAAGENAPGWLGVSAEAVGEELMRHLGLDHGVMLKTVAPDSPAAKAGLAVHDILTEVDGKAVGAMEDLRGVIQGHEAGDEVDLKAIQKGRRVDKKVELGEAPGAQIGAGFNILPMGPDENGRRQLQLNLQNLRLQGAGQLQLGIEAGGGSIKMKDAEGSVEVKTKKDAREVTVRDRDGEIEYDGPWDTPQDKAAVPPELRKRIEAVTSMFGGGANQFGLQVVPVPGPDEQEDPKEDAE